jgi:HK97 family phage prohead protease
MAFKKTFIISDESVNSYGFSIVTSGVKLDNAKRNCPAFYDHRTWETPIGHWENLRVENSKLLGDLVIEGADEREKEYIRKIENGDIKGASGGFDPITWTEEEKYMKKGQTAPTLSESELFEASITPLPGNSNCLALKKDNSLVVLSDGKPNTIIPSLNKNSDMKKIALQLGLKDDATEAEIITAISSLQLSHTNTEAMRIHIEEQAAEQLQGEPEKKLFVELSKTNISQALAFLALNKKGVQISEGQVSGGTSKVQKDVKISDLIQKGKQSLSRNTGDQSDEKTNCFDYFQRKKPAELKRIKTEEPERYAQLVADYAAGIRYSA